MNKKTIKLTVDEETAEDEIVPAVSYDISTYGSDPDVETLVKRLKSGIIVIPKFQREYVWKLPEASRLIESLLLGLPIPSIFLAKEKDGNKLLVIDGQQRLKTMQYFIDGIFEPTGKPFALVNVQKRFENKIFKKLSPEDQDKINQAIIHCTNIKQNTPNDDDTSIYHIFERLNSEGRKLNEQEIRIAVYHGELMQVLNGLNDTPIWRKLYGSKNPRRKDEEAILRFFAFRSNRASYSRPLSEFLNKYCGKNRNDKNSIIENLKNEFLSCLELIKVSIGEKAFKPSSAFNVAAFEAIMVGIAENYTKISGKGKKTLLRAYQNLLANEEFKASISTSTADEKSVENRFTLAIKAFKL